MITLHPYNIHHTPFGSKKSRVAPDTDLAGYPVSGRMSNLYTVLSFMMIRSAESEKARKKKRDWNVGDPVNAFYQGNV